MKTASDHTDDLIRLLDNWKKSRIVVAGDFMLDHHVYGSADRLSPDAPVPVLAAEREEHHPGGAANVALDLCALNCDVACLGVVGRDDSAITLRKSLRAAGCSVTGLITVADRPTSVKHNFIGLAQHKNPQKMFRVDGESSAPIPAAVHKKIIDAAKKLLPADALCLQDHNKGVLTETLCQQLIRLARRHRVPVFVDPAAIDSFAKYRGATCLTPNRFEAALALGRADPLTDDAQLKQIARKILQQLKLTAVVLTLDKQGSLLIEKGKRALHLHTRAREVYDVTGAGDMIIATLAAARTNRVDWPLALQLANIAAGLEVERFGVVPIELHEILLALLEKRHEDLGKLRTLDQFLPELSAHRRAGKSIAFTNGCFDILHAGHVAYLRAAAQLADLLVVAVNADSSIRRIKGPGRPVNRINDRLMVLSELQSIDYLIVFNQDTPIDLLQAVKPDVLVKGGDYKLAQVIGVDLIKHQGGRVALIDPIKGKSTTNIIRKITTKR